MSPRSTTTDHQGARAELATPVRFELHGRALAVVAALAAAAIGGPFHRQAPGRAEVAGDVQLGIEVVGADRRDRLAATGRGAKARSASAVLVMRSWRDLGADRRLAATTTAAGQVCDHRQRLVARRQWHGRAKTTPRGQT